MEGITAAKGAGDWPQVKQKSPKSYDRRTPKTSEGKKTSLC